jgi:hypothetical protein
MPVTVYIYRNGIQVRSTTIQVPTTVKQLTIPITYLDTNKSSSATTYSFQIYAGTYTGSNIDDYIFVYSIDEFWVEYKR